LFIGERELEENIFVLRNLLTSQEERHGVPRLVSLLSDHRKRA